MLLAKDTIITCSLSSGSSGNSIYIGGEEGEILIDAGIAAKSIADKLRKVGTGIENITAIFITHEHIDHVRGLDILLKHREIPVYMNRRTYNALYIPPHVGRCVRVIDGEEIKVGSFAVRSFPTPHDSAASVGYTISREGRKLIGVATDIGHLTDVIAERLTGCHTVYIESNHDVRRLMNGSYAPSLKRRILSPNGHLANEDCARFLPALVEAGTKNIILFHLSRENNTEALAMGQALSALSSGGLDWRAVNIQIAPPTEISGLMEIS